MAKITYNKAARFSPDIRLDNLMNSLPRILEEIHKSLYRLTKEENILLKDVEYSVHKDDKGWMLKADIRINEEDIDKEKERYRE